ncbi:MAG: tetratricopeptide repeat protein [Alphaproteobacteria bacterium]|nr:tetratricopeptide repeat protein [Alphaproteobacteria bacterium]
MIPFSYTKLTVCFSLLLGLAACGPDLQEYEDSGSPAAGMVRLAEQMRSRGDDAGAVDFYQRALQRDPKDVVAYRGIGEILEKMGNAEAAAEKYRMALTIDPDNADLLRRYGRVLIALDMPAEAKDQYLKALDEDSDDPKALNGLGIALDYLGDHRGAQEKYKEALEEDPDNLNTLNNLAYSFIVSGSYDEAIKLLEPQLKNTAATPALRQNLALAYGLSGMDLDAERVARMDLTLAKVKSNMSYYRRKRAELTVSSEPYAELGNYATKAMAEVWLGKIKALGIPADIKTMVVPEVAVPGGTPRFTIHLSGCQSGDGLRELCKDLVKRDIPCLIRKN